MLKNWPSRLFLKALETPQLKRISLNWIWRETPLQKTQVRNPTIVSATNSFAFVKLILTEWLVLATWTI